jgi:hypothetical protein
LLFRADSKLQHSSVRASASCISHAIVSVQEAG